MNTIVSRLSGYSPKMFLPLRAMVQQLTADLSLDEILPLLLSQAIDVCHASSGAYYELKLPQKKIIRRSCVGSEQPDHAAKAALACLLKERDLVVEEMIFLQEERSASTELEKREFLIAAPVVTDKQVQGALLFHREIPFGDEEIAFLGLTASFVGIALQNSQLLLREREQRLLAEALTDTAAALNSTLTLDKVLDRILIDLKRVVPHDASHVMLLEGETAQVVRSQGYAERGLEETLLQKQFPIQQVPHLRRILQNGKPLAISYTRKSRDWANLPEVEWIESYAGAPIRIKDKIVGFLSVDSAAPGFFTRRHAQRLESFSDQAAIALENARLYQAIEQVAITDELTGLLNRHGLKDIGQRELIRSRRYGHPLSALLIDIDNFKDINDTFGHPVGDEVIQAVADHCRRILRKTDVISRIGGDEIFVMLAETTFSQAHVLAERIRTSFCETKVATKQGLISVTISLGLCEITEAIDDVFSLLAVADRALYQAKGSGKNRVAELPR